MNTPRPVVLVVDDDAETRAAICDVLQENGLGVAEASNGRAALDVLTSPDKPAVVVLDLDMPIMSGLELLDIMRRYNRLSRIPVFVLSGTDWSVAGAPVVHVFNKSGNVDALVAAARAYAGTAAAPPA